MIAAKNEAFSKKHWEAPKVMDLNVEVIRQEEMEIFLRMMENPELFKMMQESGPI